MRLLWDGPIQRLVKGPLPKLLPHPFVSLLVEFLLAVLRDPDGKLYCRHAATRFNDTDVGGTWDSLPENKNICVYITRVEVVITTHVYDPLELINDRKVCRVHEATRIRSFPILVIM